MSIFASFVYCMNHWTMLTSSNFFCFSISCKHLFESVMLFVKGFRYSHIGFSDGGHDSRQSLDAPVDEDGSGLFILPRISQFHLSPSVALSWTIHGSCSRYTIFGSYIYWFCRSWVCSGHFFCSVLGGASLRQVHGNSMLDTSLLISGMYYVCPCITTTPSYWREPSIIIRTHIHVQFVYTINSMWSISLYRYLGGCSNPVRKKRTSRGTRSACVHIQHNISQSKHCNRPMFLTGASIQFNSWSVLWYTCRHMAACMEVGIYKGKQLRVSDVSIETFYWTNQYNHSAN